MKKFLILLIFLSSCLGIVFYELSVQPGPSDHSVNVVILKGTSLQKMADSLAEAKVIRYPWLFKVAARFQGLDKKLRAGEYQFPQQVSLKDVLDKVAKGEVFYRRVTLPEGMTVSQIFDLVSNIPELSGDISVEINEGELLPETYTFEFGDSRDSLLLQAREAMTKTLSEIWENRDVSLPLKDEKQLLTLASIVEKETGVPEERALVSSVFVNRLKKGMKLQTDPTVIYAVTNGKENLGRSLKRTDLEIDNPYNTYKYYGLPPTPICNPGREALEAAAHPQPSNYLFFVASGSGGHNFSSSLQEHNKNVANWVKSLKK